MSNDNNTTINLYFPPDFSLFKRFGHGLVWRAKLEVDFLESTFSRAQWWINYFESGKWLEGMSTADIIGLYANQLGAEEAVERLRSMSGEELKKHIDLDGPVDIDALALRTNTIIGYVQGWEERQPKIIQEHLNLQMEKALQDWDKALNWAEGKPDRPYVVDENEMMESISDFTSERDYLENFRLSMHLVRHVMLYEDEEAIKKTGKPAVGRLPKIKFREFEEKLLELDERFRKVLGNRRAEKPAFWTDPTFWWNHPPKKRLRR